MINRRQSSALPWLCVIAVLLLRSQVETFMLIISVTRFGRLNRRQTDGRPRLCRDYVLTLSAVAVLSHGTTNMSNSSPPVPSPLPACPHISLRRNDITRAALTGSLPGSLPVSPTTEHDCVAYGALCHNLHFLFCQFSFGNAVARTTQNVLLLKSRSSVGSKAAYLGATCTLYHFPRTFYSSVCDTEPVIGLASQSVRKRC